MGEGRTPEIVRREITMERERLRVVISALGHDARGARRLVVTVATIALAAGILYRLAGGARHASRSRRSVLGRAG